ncbi:MAG: IS200/IS605 family transposase [Candidatus Kapabacteria bacterium]|nr:IS200/IS605 family transposase [Candidatus Kapabacteria bacterium]
MWAVKDRQKLILPRFEEQIYNYIREQFIDILCPVRIINGMPDHVHCLFLQNPKIAMTDIIKQIKGSSSHFINQNNFFPGKFSWQSGCAVYSVSESIVNKVFEYIKNQKEHHRKLTFQEEFDKFVMIHEKMNENRIIGND